MLLPYNKDPATGLIVGRGCFYTNFSINKDPATGLIVGRGCFYTNFSINAVGVFVPANVICFPIFFCSYYSSKCHLMCPSTSADGQAHGSLVLMSFRSTCSMAFLPILLNAWVPGIILVSTSPFDIGMIALKNSLRQTGRLLPSCYLCRAWKC